MYVLFVRTLTIRVREEAISHKEFLLRRPCLRFSHLNLHLACYFEFFVPRSVTLSSDTTMLIVLKEISVFCQEIFN